MTFSLHQLTELFGSLDRVNLMMSWNAAPTQALPIIRRGREGEMRLTNVRWGLVPHWSKTGPDGSKPLINARSETAAEKPTFRQALERRRALIPANGFYEWAKAPDGTKQPWYITRTDDQPMVMAGVWERWGEGADRIDSFAILTTEANSDIAHLHHRSPVFIPETGFADWLNPEVDPQVFLSAPPVGSLKAHPVSRQVNSVAVDRADLIEPVDLEPAPELDDDEGFGPLF